MDTKLRPSGIEGLGDMAWGTHFCIFYETKEDVLDILIPYFKAGLENNEFFLCVASPPLSTEEAQQAMQEAVPDFERYLSEGQIEIVSYRDWLLTGGQLDTQRVLQNWIAKLNWALAKGYAGLRFAGDPSWLDKQAWGSVPEFEKQLDQIVSNSQMLGLCAYALERCSAADVLDVVNHHQFTFAKRNGVWEHLESSELKRAHDEIQQLNAELEQRVAARTAELASINEQLRAEIVERKQMEEALRESEEKFSAAFRASPTALVIATLDGKFVEMNQAYCNLLGYSREELIGKTGVELGVFTKEARHEWVETFDRNGDVITNREFSFRVRNGISRTVLSSVEKITFHGVPHYLSTILDITERQRAEEALRKSERVLREAEVLGHTGSWEQDLITGEIFNTEENLRLFFGDDRSKGSDFEDYAQIVHPDDREYVLRRRAELLEEEGPSDIEYSVIWPDGSIHVIFGRATVVRNELGQAIRVYGTNVDITERKRAEEETKHQAARAETLARIAARLNKHLDLDAVIHAVCEEAINTFKVSQATMSLYDKKRDLLVYAGGINIPPEYASIMEPITRSQFDDFLRLMGPIMVVPDIQSVPDVPNAQFSSHLDVRTVVTAAMLRDQELVGVLVLGVNGHVREFDNDELTLLKAISDQAAQAIANAMLLKAANEQHEQLRALSAKLVEVQETERQALTTELHDRVGQNLTGLSINLQNMKALLSDKTAQTLTAKFDDAQALVEHITRQIRDIMAELHPPELEDYGLAVALETYAERVASRGNLELIADLPDLAPPPLPSEVRIALFRAAQEAIGNVLKHANATQLEVSLEERDGSVHLSVEDDGQGFEPDAASQKEAPTWGVKIMRERIEAIGGKVQIESAPGGGTRVTFEVERQS
jgi:PAS domain S-box-containing protein